MDAAPVFTELLTQAPELHGGLAQFLINELVGNMNTLDVQQDCRKTTANN